MTGLSLITPPPVTCPPWCVRTARDHRADVVDSHNPPIHYGPEFSEGPLLVVVQTRGDEPQAVICADGDVLTSDPQVLRTLMSELEKAAEWLEANR